MKKNSKTKMLLSFLLLVLCTIAMANLNEVEKDLFGKQTSTERFVSELSFSPSTVRVSLSSGVPGSTIANIPIGYDSLHFEYNYYCTVLAYGNQVTVFGNEITHPNGCDVKGTVYPQFLRGLMDQSAYLKVIVEK